MEHPLIAVQDDLTEEQLLDKVTELRKKLMIASRMGNADLCNQIRMALESFQTRYDSKIRKNNDNNFDEIINIS